jgi:hypothetical protein
MTSRELNDRLAASIDLEVSQLTPSRLAEILTRSRTTTLAPWMLCEVVNVRSVTNIIRKLPRAID